MTRVAIVAPDEWTVWWFYRHLISALQRAGAEITAFTLAGPHVPKLTSMDVEHVSVPYGRFVNPGTDIQLYRALRREFTARKFDIVQNITIKANLFGALAAHSAGVSNILNTVEGAGLLYSDNPSPRVKAIRAIAEIGLKRALPHVSQYWFVNDRDRDLFVGRGLADGNKSVVGMATGVDTDQFNRHAISETELASIRKELCLDDNQPIVLNIAGRLLRSKGIAEFVASARIVRARGKAAQFVLVGPQELGNPDQLPIGIVSDAVKEGVLKWISFREDVPQMYALATVAVIPTYYAEGTPKGILEGMAMGLPLVSTDIPSISALVSPREDALLVPPRSGVHLADAICELLDSAELRKKLGTAARKKAVSKFDAGEAAAIAVDRVYGRLPAWSARTRPAQ
jgi:glycosyltransferase involved in cell wall biosynthesis